MQREITVLPKEQIFQRGEDSAVARRVATMSGQRAKNNHGHKGGQNRCCASCSGCVQEIP